MKAFDFNKYIKNNPLLKENDEYGDDPSRGFNDVEDVVSAFATFGAQVDYEEDEDGNPTIMYTAENGEEGTIELDGTDPESAEIAFDELVDKFPDIASQM
jgi:hypothetical protein